MSGRPDDLLSVPEGLDIPSLHKVLLPSRAVLLSWQKQTLPARSAALEDAVEHFNAAQASENVGLRDIALLGVIADAMQPVEDLAYLGAAWDRPFPGLANYVRATTYSRFTPTNFWQESPRWDDDRIRLFAGLAGREAPTGRVESLLEGIGAAHLIDEGMWQALRRAEQATVVRLRRVLAVLASDWKQLSAYFVAFKHGGLAINRADAAFVEDDVMPLRDDTPKHDPSIAVWTRGGRKDDLRADFRHSPQEVVDLVGGGGRLAIDLVDAFVESRMAVFDGVEFAADGTMLGLRPLQLPWTIWLREQDLPATTGTCSVAAPSSDGAPRRQPGSEAAPPISSTQPADLFMPGATSPGETPRRRTYAHAS